MSLRRRNRALSEFHRIKNERDTADIPYVTFTINKSDWVQSLKNKIIEELNKGLDDTDAGLQPVMEKFLSSKNASPVIDKEWKLMKKSIEGWMKHGQRPTWFPKKDNANRWVSDNGRAYTFTCTRRVKTLKSGKRNKNWVGNVTRSLKTNVLTKFHKGFSTAEHGKLVQRFQTYGQKFIDIDLLGTGMTPTSRPGSEGNNIGAAIIAGINANGNSWDWVAWETGLIQNYFSYKYGTRVDRRTTRNSLLRKHHIRIVMVPGRSVGNTGAPDRQDSKEWQLLFENEFTKKMNEHASKLSGIKKIDFISSSPDFDDEGAGISEDMMVEMLEKAIKGMRKSNAKMREKGKITIRTKKPTFSKQLEQVRYEKKQGKESFVQPKRNQASKKVTGRKAAKVKGAATAIGLSKISPNKRGEAIQQAGFKMDKEGLLIRDLLNRIMPRALDRNMKAPRLQNRKGGFKRSVEVDQVIVGPRGGLYIDYTYDQNPYGVFEPGLGKAPWANQFRDPKHLIGMSIRQIVQANMRGQAVTSLRRVFK